MSEAIVSPLFVRRIDFAGFDTNPANDKAIVASNPDGFPIDLLGFGSGLFIDCVVALTENLFEVESEFSEVFG